MDAVSINQRATHWLESFQQALSTRNTQAIVSLFDEECYWRDLVAFTWNIKTLEGQQAILDMLQACLHEVRPSQFMLHGEASETSDGIVEAWFAFETAVARGRGHLRLKNDKCFTLLSTMTELKGFEEKRGRTREPGLLMESIKGRQTWADRKAEEESKLGYTEQPYCVIVGGGQGGLALGARLKQLGVPAIILDKHERPGDAWRKRYHSLYLHDPVWYDHLPYLPFPDHWPVYSSKDKIADWLEMYAKVMELDYWHSSECKSASFDEQRKTWTVVVRRSSQEIILHPTQLIFATGMSGVPNQPVFPGMDNFEGVQYHSSQFSNSKAFRGKKCLVIGSNTSAHDIAADLYENDAEVTMIQRSSTLVIKSTDFEQLMMAPCYSEDALEQGISTEKADLIVASRPYKILPELHRPISEKCATKNPEYYGKLEKAGFMLDWGEDGSGLTMKYLRRGSGYYIDVGASELIASGKIKLRSRVSVQEIKKNTVALSDGSEEFADLIVYATGYGSMNIWVERIISKEVADKVGKCWGLGSDTTNDPGPWEGELRNMWKPTQQENLWFHGGNLRQSRHYSLYLALQLKARMEGLSTPVYGLQEVYHVR